MCTCTCKIIVIFEKVEVKGEDVGYRGKKREVRGRKEMKKIQNKKSIE